MRNQGSSDGALRALPLLATLFSASCSFQTQPLYQAARLDAGSTGLAAGAVGVLPSKDPGTSGLRDAGEPVLPDSAAPANDATVAADGGCTPGAITSCKDGIAQTCAADGSGFAGVPCDHGCNAAANGCSECMPGTQQCVGNAIVNCGPDEKLVPVQTCAMGCAVGSDGMAACTACMPNAASCQGKELTRCSPDGREQTTMTCADGCDPMLGLCVNAVLKPANLDADTCGNPGGNDFDVQDHTSIDTDDDCSLVVQQGDGLPAICVHKYRQIHVRAGAVLEVTGKRALALVGTDTVSIEGTIDVSAHIAKAGAGASLSDAGVGQTAVGRSKPAMTMMTFIEQAANAAGGGGGFGVRGASGGGAPGDCGMMLPCAAAGAGGAIFGDPMLVPLQGGAAGGNNSASDLSTRRGTPGAGGGALELIGCEELTLGAKAILAANGGGGGGGNPGTAENTSDTPGGGTGGGSGGAILIQARTLTVQAGALLVANGGGGGGGASRTAGPGKGNGNGNTSMMLVSGQNGEDGQLGMQPAAGGKAAGDSMPGGQGGTRQAPTSGGTAMMPTQAAGGGGGAAGRIRIDTATGGVAPGLATSPAATMGRAAFD